MVPNNTNNNNSILLEVLASLFTVSAYFPDNPRTFTLTIYFWSYADPHSYTSRVLPVSKLRVYLYSVSGIFQEKREESYDKYPSTTEMNIQSNITTLQNVRQHNDYGPT